MVKTLVARDRYFMKKPCVAATSDDIAISIDLRDTLRIYSKEICGLSANMIGYNKRIIAFIDTSSPVPVPRIMYNPVIESGTGSCISRERCPVRGGRVYRCERYKRITVRFLNENLVEQTESFEGQTAYTIQHEIDHISGKAI